MQRELNPVVITGRPEYFEAMGWSKFMPFFDALYLLDFEGELELDLETSGLGSFLLESVHSLQIGMDGYQFVFDVPSLDLTIPGWQAQIKKLLGLKLVFIHNASFDLPYLYQWEVCPRKVYDTLVAENVLTRGLLLPRGARSLGSLCKKYLNIDVDKQLQKTIAEGINSVEDIEYAATDVLYLRDLRTAQVEIATRMDIQREVDLCNSFVRVLAYIEFSGVKIDIEKLTENIRENEFLEWEALKKLRQYGEVNWASPKQVAEVLKEHGIEEYKEETGNPATGEKILQKHRDKPIAQDLLTFRQYAKLVSTYGRVWYHYILKDGRVHTRYKQFTETGRTSSGATSISERFDPRDPTFRMGSPFPNMQNIPRGSIREMFVPKKGNKLVVADFGQQELVIFADQCREPNLVKAIQSGQDMHSVAVRLVYPELKDLMDDEIKRDHAEKRDICKQGWYTITYMGNEYTIAENLNISIELATSVYDALMHLYGGIKDYWKLCYDFVSVYGYIPTCKLTGGKRFFNKSREFRGLLTADKIWAEYNREKVKGSARFLEMDAELGWFNKLKSRLRRISVNTPTQGTGGVMSKIAGIYIFEHILNKGYFGKVLIPIFEHDSYVVEAPDRHAEEMKEVVQKSMELAGTQVLSLLKIKADAKITDSWKK